MRKVVDASQVCHLWANKSQDEARTPSGNIYFTGPTLYSYGEHFVIAHHLENGGILWNGASYSNTTSKQQSFARQSLASWQRDKVVNVPFLKRDHVHELERVKREGTNKLPDLARKLAEDIVSTVENMASMREGKGPERGAFNAIKSNEAAGLYLCAYVAKGKRAPKWPLAPLPDTMPTGDARKAWIQSVAKGKLLGTHDSALSAALHNIAELETLAEEAAQFDTFGDWWRVNNARGSLDGAGRNLTEAGKAYEAATGKKSAKVRNAWKRHTAAEAKLMPLVSVYEAKRARQAIKSHTREVWQEMQRRGNAFSRAGRALSYLLSKISDALRYLPAEEAAQHAAFVARLTRVVDWDAAEEGLKNAGSNFETAMSYCPEHPGDAKRHFQQARMHADEAAKRHPGFAALHAEELSQIAEQTPALVEEMRAAMMRKHAEKIEAWKAGENVSLPYGDGLTLARIKGNIVQTSRGASVPLSHACRLARIARRVIAHGGKTWEHGEGPRVGGFMVRSIGADGSAVIGCHEFDWAESLRVLALLDVCPECQGVTEESDEG